MIIDFIGKISKKTILIIIGGLVLIIIGTKILLRHLNIF